jgi:hypothetical protein
MDENSVSPSRSWKKRLGRLALWMLGVFLLFSLGLIGISLPNLTQKVSPPEISGPRQLERIAQNGEVSRTDKNGETPRPDDEPTSRTVIVDASGREVLNLRDFPHLSPTMQLLTEEWIVAWKELEKIAKVDNDSTNSARARQRLFQIAQYIQGYLNFPLEWGNISYQKALDKEFMFLLQNGLACNSILGDLPDEQVALPFAMRLDSICFDMRSRLLSELAIQHGEWRDSILAFSQINTYRRHQEYYDSSQIAQRCWEDELYCWRQMGLAGQVGLIARSYEKRIPPSQTPNLKNDLMHLPAEVSWNFMISELWRKNWTPPQNPSEFDSEM